MTAPEPEQLQRRFLPVIACGKQESVHVELVPVLRTGRGRTLGFGVWRQDFESAADARAVFEWMIGRPERCLVWGRLAPIIGDKLLSDCIANEMLADYKKRQEEKEARSAEARRATKITVHFVEQKGRPALTMQRGADGEPFCSIAFSEKWERDRVWDWMSWQSGHYEEWRIHAAVRGGNSLARRIFEGMLTTEAAVRKAGLATRGRRPLRFWRGEA